MKKYLVYLLIIVSMFIGANVSAKTCKYSNYYQLAGNTLDAELEYDGKKYSAKIYTFYLGSKKIVDNKAGKKYTTINILGNVDENSCPTALYAKIQTKSGLFGIPSSYVAIYITNDDDAYRMSTCVEKCYYAISSDATLSSDDVEFGNRLINDALSLYEGYAEYLRNFDVSSCKSESFVAPYEECTDKIRSSHSVRSSKYKEAKSLEYQNEVWEKNSNLIKLTNMYNEAEVEYGKVITKLAYAAAEGNVNYWYEMNKTAGDNRFSKQLQEAENKARESKKQVERTEYIYQDASETCQGLLGDETLKFLKDALNLIRIIGPILALVLGTYDLVSALINGEEDAKKKAMKKVKGRIIAAVLLLLVPTILNFILGFANQTWQICPEIMK